MLQLTFTKMHGAANDYIYFNLFNEQNETFFNAHLYNFEEELKLGKLIREWSSRRTGVGSDGAIIIQKPSNAFKLDPVIYNNEELVGIDVKSLHAHMIMYNSDGTRGKMCGNGLRCVTKFVYDHLLPEEEKKEGKELRILTDAGVKICKVNPVTKEVTMDLGKPIFAAVKVPFNPQSSKLSSVSLGELPQFPAIQAKVSFPTEFNKQATKEFTIHPISMGNPHCVVFLEQGQNLDEFPLAHYGPLLERDLDLFPERVNVEFVEVVSVEHNELVVKQRTWERGSDETYACGSGAAAVAVLSFYKHFYKPELQSEVQAATIKVHLKGGILTCNYSTQGTEYSSVVQNGDATEVFSGILNVKQQ